MINNLNQVQQQQKAQLEGTGKSPQMLLAQTFQSQQKTLLNVFEGDEKRLNKFISALISAIFSNQKTLTALIPIITENPMSIVRAAIKGAELNLNFSLGQFWIVPFSNEAVYMTGYKGWEELAKRNKDNRDISYGYVYEGQSLNELVKYNIEETRTGKLIISSNIEEKNGSEKIKGYYCKSIEVKDDDIILKHTYMSVAEAKAYQQKYIRFPKMWNSEFDKMALKTVIMQHCRQLKLETTVAEQLAFEEQFENEDKINILSEDDIINAFAEEKKPEPQPEPAKPKAAPKQKTVKPKAEEKKVEPKPQPQQEPEEIPPPSIEDFEIPEEQLEEQDLKYTPISEEPLLPDGAIQESLFEKQNLTPAQEKLWGLCLKLNDNLESAKLYLQKKTAHENNPGWTNIAEVEEDFVNFHLREDLTRSIAGEAKAKGLL